MIYSLNEIDAMGKRAARGAGLDWGFAEEAGKAIRWLSANNLPGAEALCEVLTLNEGKTYEELVPTSVDGTWVASSGTLCPIITGAALSDRAHRIASGQNIKLAKIIKPLLLLPYLANVAKQTGITVEITWQGTQVTVCTRGISIKGDDLEIGLVDEVKCHRADFEENVTSGGVVGRAVNREAWDSLTAFMTRYLAPNTEESRIAGAGSSGNDGD